MLSEDEKQELELLRRSAARFMTCPLERAFFELESLMDRPYSNRGDGVMSSSAFRVLAKALIELRRKLCDENCSG